ncbi:hypothetical protein N8768_07540, partial [Flavobacteriaceae bacterium]|nr:hypothetical protein [Flavobacteriaceae bacterium]
VTIFDETAPVISGVEDDYTVECPEDYKFSEPTATDTCDSAPLLTFVDDDKRDDCGLGSITRTWTATDCAGNTSNASQTITIEDNAAPVIDGVGEDFTVECPEGYEFSEPTASDTCDDANNSNGGDMTVSNNGSSFVSWESELDAEDDIWDSYGSSHHEIYPMTVEVTGEYTFNLTSSTNNRHFVCLLEGNDQSTDWYSSPNNLDIRYASSVQNAGTFTTGLNAGQQYYLIIKEDNGTFGPMEGTISGAGSITISDTGGGYSSVSLTYEDVEDLDDCGLGTITRTWTATDCAGNSSTDSQIVTIEDNTAPVISGVEASFSVECPEDYKFSEPTVSDTCDTEPFLDFSDDDKTDACGLGEITRTWTATDCAGNTSTASQTITIYDETDPYFNEDLPQDVTEECDAVTPAATLTASDTCDMDIEVMFNESTTPGDCPGRYTIVRTWSASDCAGNSIEYVQTVTVVDTTAPVEGDNFVLPESANEIDGCAADYMMAPMTEAEFAMMFTDNCSNVVVSLTSSPVGDDCGWSVMHKYAVSDDCGNSLGNYKVFYSGSDMTAPELMEAPADVTVSCMDVPEAPELMAMDTCDSDVDVTFSEEAMMLNERCGDIDITRTWTAVDNCGNETVHTQVIQVRDMEAPVLTGDLPEGTNENDACAPESDEELAALGVLTASEFTDLYTDDCNTVVVNRVVNIDGDNCKWIMWVRYDVSDSCGNEAQSVKLWYQGADATGPEITKAEDVTEECDGTDDALNAWLADNGGNTATDCGEFTWTNDYDSRASTEGDGCTTVTTVTFTATDACGNESSTTSTFTVEDTTAPVFVDTDCDTTVELDFDPNNGPGDKDGFTYLGEYEGHYYYITTETMSATDGNILVGNNGGYMATITDADENQWIYDAAVASNGGNNIRFWIGLTDVAEEGVFLWMDGTTFDYENWHNGEPNNLNGNEHCVELGRFNSSTWNDEPCTNQKYILMEVDGASLKEEAAYTDACAGDGATTDYTDVLTPIDGNNGGALDAFTILCDINGPWSTWNFSKTGYDAEGYAMYTGLLPEFPNEIAYVTYNLVEGRFEVLATSIVNAFPDRVVFVSYTNGNYPSCDSDAWQAIVGPCVLTMVCDDAPQSQQGWKLERTFTATDGCNESTCTVTYSWSDDSIAPPTTPNLSVARISNGNPTLGNGSSKFGDSQANSIELDFLAYPVPFDRDVNVKFNFEFDTDVTIEVHDTRGLLVKSMTLNNVRANTEIKKNFDLSRAGDQLFYITVTTNQGSVTKKAVSSNMKRR